MINVRTYLTLGACAAYQIALTSAAPLPWSGEVVDIRSGAPIQGVRVYGGAQGRVDLTAAGFTDVEGAFVVTYDAPLDLGFWQFYMLTADYPADGGLYFQYRRKSPAPAPVQMKMVPRNCYLRGVVKDKATGLPVAGASVSICRPGQVRQTMPGNALGEFQFVDSAYDGFNNYEEGIPLEDQVPHDTTAVPVTNYYFSVSAAGYKSLDTGTQGPTVAVISSVSSNLHTFLTFELAASSDPTGTSSGSSGIVNPQAYQQWAAQYFTPTELAEGGVGAAAADPDTDGLSNENEFAAGTHPKNADSDGDTLPDGWEQAHQLNPLAADAAADPDADGFSNRIEWVYSTDPQAAGSKPDITVSVRRAIRVDFPTRAGVRYQLQRADSVDGIYQDVGSEFTGDGQPVEQSFVAESAAQQFYRLSVSVP